MRVVLAAFGVQVYFLNHFPSLELIPQVGGQLSFNQTSRCAQGVDPYLNPALPNADDAEH